MRAAFRPPIVRGLPITGPCPRFHCCMEKGWCRNRGDGKISRTGKSCRCSRAISASAISDSANTQYVRCLEYGELRDFSRRKQCVDLVQANELSRLIGVADGQYGVEYAAPESVGISKDRTKIIPISLSDAPTFRAGR